MLQRFAMILSAPLGLMDIATSLRRGVSANLVAFVVIGISGILLNVSIVFFYDAETLGIFNTILAIYIVGGQFGAAGLQYSTLYFASAHGDTAKTVSDITVVALGMALLLSTVICLTIVAILSMADIGASFEQAMRFALPGLFAFPLNKVMMAALNGRQRTGIFAIFNAGRVALILAACIIIGLSGANGSIITACLSVAELVVFSGLIWTIRLRLTGTSSGSIRLWSARHVHFASRTMMSGLLAELNSRIDILCLSALASPTVVGIYSVGSMFAEGLLQLLMVLRINIDPLLARFSSQGRADQLAALIAWAKRIAFRGMMIVGATAILLYPAIVPLVVDWPQFAGSWSVFAILTSGIIGSAAFIPLYGIFQHNNHPMRQTVFLALVTGANVAFNLTLIFFFGMIGAAIGTALSFLCAPLFLRALARNVLLAVP